MDCQASREATLSDRPSRDSASAGGFGRHGGGADHLHLPVGDDASDGHVLVDLFELQHSRGSSKGPTSRPLIPPKGGQAQTSDGKKRSISVPNLAVESWAG